MIQLDLFSNDSHMVRCEINSLQKSVRGLFARFNHLEKEWIDFQKYKESNASQSPHKKAPKGNTKST